MTGCQPRHSCLANSVPVHHGSIRCRRSPIPNTPDSQSRILGESLAITRVFNLVERVAPTPETVLLTGESGTGKKAVARKIHNRANSSDRPVVLVNCAAIPENLIEAELFGYQRDAFTDAKIDCSSWQREARSSSIRWA